MKTKILKTKPKKFWTNWLTIKKIPRSISWDVDIFYDMKMLSRHNRKSMSAFTMEILKMYCKAEIKKLKNLPPKESYGKLKTKAHKKK